MDKAWKLISELHDLPKPQRAEQQYFERFHLHRRALVSQPRTVAWGALWVVLGLTPYLYVPLAATFGHSVDNWDHANSVGSLTRLILRSDYGGTTVALGSARHSGQFFSAVWYLFKEIGVLLGAGVILGAVASLTRLRWYFVFTVIALGFSILEFTVVAGLDPKVGTAFFVLERFYLMPMVLLAPLVAVGIVGVVDWICSRPMMLDVGRGQLAVGSLLAFLLVASSVGIASANYATINVAHDKVTENYVRDALSGLPQDAVLFVTGDFADFPVLYAQAVQHVRKDVTVVVSPLLAAPWYQTQLRSEHHLKISQHVNTRELVAANPSRQFFFIGQPPDKTLAGFYYFATQGLTSKIVPQAQNTDLTTFAAQNSTLLAQYHVPDWRTIKRNSFESFILDAYANIPASIASNYAAANSIGLAIKFYEQAHALDPRNAVVIKRLKQLKSGTA